MLAISEELHSGMFGGVGNLVQHYVYSPFGKTVKIENAAGADITATPMVDNSFAFTGREYDKESGLYYYRARYYDSETGRFIQSDPHPGASNNPASFNSKYIYVNNNPFKNVDPTGTFTLRNALALAITFAIAYGTGFGIGYLAGNAFAGAILGGFIGGMIGGEVAYRSNIILGGSKEDSSKLRQAGKIVGAIAGSMGGRAGAEYKLTNLALDTSKSTAFISEGFCIGLIAIGIAAIIAWKLGPKFIKKGNENKTIEDDLNDSSKDSKGGSQSAPPPENSTSQNGGQCGSAA